MKRLFNSIKKAAMILCVVITTCSNIATIGHETTAISVNKELPNNIDGAFKSYMDYRKITNKNSKQWKLQQEAITDKNGFRKYNDMYMVALGTYYSKEIGAVFEIELESGSIMCVTGDIKNDKHTDSTNRYNETNNNIVEFIVDTDNISRISKQMGDMSYSGLEGRVVRISEVQQSN